MWNYMNMDCLVLASPPPAPPVLWYSPLFDNGCLVRLAAHHATTSSKALHAVSNHNHQPQHWVYHSVTTKLVVTSPKLLNFCCNLQITFKSEYHTNGKAGNYSIEILTVEWTTAQAVKQWKKTQTAETRQQG